MLRQERARRRVSPKAQAERPKAEARGRERAEDQRGPDTKREAAGNSMRAAIPLRQACLNNTRHIRKASASYARRKERPKGSEGGPSRHPGLKGGWRSKEGQGRAQEGGLHLSSA